MLLPRHDVQRFADHARTPWKSWLVTPRDGPAHVPLFQNDDEELSGGLDPKTGALQHFSL